MNKKAEQYKVLRIKLESKVRKNSHCRSNKGLLSCNACDDWNTCRAHDYDALNEQVRKVGDQLDAKTKLKIIEEVKNG